MLGGNTVAIRRATIDDASEIARLATELGYPTSLSEMSARLTRLIGDPAHCIVVASGDGDALKGWAHVEDRFSLEGGARIELMGLVIDASVRRQGIGSSLLRATESWAADRGRTRITVRSNVLRTLSHPFYESCGYTREKTQHVYSKALPSDTRGFGGKRV